MIKSAIFDVDGTLLDSMKIWDDAGERYLSSVGKTAENGLSEKLCDMSLTEGAEYMKKQYALPFEADPRKLFKIGVNFSNKTRNIEKWIIE